MKYDMPKAISKEDAFEAFRSQDDKRICEAIISLALHESDWRWVQERCLELASSESVVVAAAAATALGHVARLQRSLDLGRVVPVLERLAQRTELRGFAEAALDDISMFIPT